MSISTVIVDDEPLARKRVRLLLDKEDDVELIAECASGEEALSILEEQSIDLLFLDVQMPGIDGFEVLQRIPEEQLPVVIFTTAYDQHALRAFESHALDYLLKPFKTARFSQAMQRARQRLKERDSNQSVHRLVAMLAEQDTRPPGSTKKYLTRLTVKHQDKVLLVQVADVTSFESAGNYVVAAEGDNNHLLRETLTALEKQLDPEQFFRVSRSAIVNLDCVHRIETMFKGEHAVVLKSGKRLTMTRGLREMEKALKP